MLTVLVPAKSFRNAKERLSRRLSREERARLGAALLRHVVSTVRQAFPEARILVVSDDQEVARHAAETDGVESVVPDVKGLNAQLAAAAADVPGRADLLVLHTDLPLLEAGDLQALVATGGDVVLATDRRGEGTNALLLRDGVRFFHFGTGSAERHRAAARALGKVAQTIHRPGLAFDLDEPEDWALLAARLDVGEDALFGRLPDFLRGWP